MAERKPAVIIGGVVRQLPEGDTLAGVGGGDVIVGVVGQIQQFPVGMQPDGYLDCDGASYDLAEYPELYAAIGDAFNREAGVFIAGKPWSHQYDTNLADNNGDLVFTKGSDLPVGLHSSQAVVTKDRVYLLGGETGTNTVTNAIYTAAIDSSGTIGSWSSAGTLPTPLSLSQAIKVGNKILLLGGNTGYGAGGATTRTNTIYAAEINQDGTLGAWSASGTIYGAICGTSALLADNTLYLFGGQTSNPASYTVSAAPIGADGTIGAWSNLRQLPLAFANGSAIKIGDELYVIGGKDTSNTSSSVITMTTVDIDGDLQPWSSATGLPGSLSYSNPILTRGRVFLIAGDVVGPTLFVYAARINRDGSLATWRTLSHFPTKASRAQAVVTSSKIYFFGGLGDSGALDSVYYASFNGGNNDYTADGFTPATPQGFFSVPSMEHIATSNGDTGRGIKYMILART